MVTKKDAKIAILHSSFTESGGAERVVLTQVELLHNNGYFVDCYGILVDSKKCFSEKVLKFNVKQYLKLVPNIKLSYSIGVPLTVLFSKKIVNLLGKYDVMICHHQPAPWLAYKTCIRHNKPYICYIHHPLRFLYPRPVDRMLGWGYTLDRKLVEIFGKNLDFIRKADKTSILKADKILVNSVKTLKEVKRIYGVNATVCYPPFSVKNRWKSSDDVDKNLKVKFFSSIGLPEEKSNPVILMVSRHTPHKRLDWLLRIFKLVRREVNCWLIVAGAFHSTYTSKIMDLALKLEVSDRVRFTGKVSDYTLSLLYLFSDVYVYTPPNEDFGLGPVEAMGYGKPVVVWDEDGPGEIVVDGVTGFKVKPYMLNEFAEKIVKLLSDEDLRRKMGLNAKEYVETNFSPENHFKVLEKTLKSVL